MCLVDWDCFGDDSVNPRVLVWLRNKNTAEPAEPLEGFIWACPDRKEWAGYGLDLPNPTHFKYVGIRPEVASVEDEGDAEPDSVPRDTESRSSGHEKHSSEAGLSRFAAIKLMLAIVIGLAILKSRTS